jgi:membrane protease subunit HflC
MKNLGTILAAIFLVAVLLLYMCTFEVRFTEVAIKKTWGKPTGNPITQPGLKWKWPKPIQTVVVYDKRTQILEDRTEETRTFDSKNLLLTTFTFWRIEDPIKFHQNFPGNEKDSVKSAEDKLRTTIITHKHAVVGKRRMNEFISTDPRERKLREIEQEIKELVARDARNEYGVQVIDFGIKRLGLPQQVTSRIFDAMKAKENEKAERYNSEGGATASQIVAEAGAAEGRILAEARRKVAAIETEAQRVVGEYYRQFDEYPQLRIFLDKLRTSAQALKNRSTIILESRESPFDVFEPEARRNVRPERPPTEQPLPEDEQASRQVIKPDLMD